MNTENQTGVCLSENAFQAQVILIVCLDFDQNPTSKQAVIKER